MSVFAAIQTAGSALRTNRVWMDAVADNLANINTIRPYDQPAFQARSILATAVRGDNNNPPGVGGGVAPTAVVTRRVARATSPTIPSRTPKASCATPTST
jgi:flagellar basal body rod protein FlgC